MPAPVRPQDPAPAAAIRPAGRQPGRFRRVLAGLASTAGLGAVFVASAVFAVVLHLDLPPAHRLAQSLVDQGLASLFHGRIFPGEIDHLSLHGVDLRSAEVLDPDGRQVVRAGGIHARADVIAIVRSALFGRGPLVVDLPYVRVDDAAVLVERGSSSVPSIADTFVLRGTPGPPVPGARPVQVDLDRIEIGHAWAHGVLASPRLLDADVSRVVGALHVNHHGVTLDVERTGLIDRALLPAATGGTADFHLRILPPQDGVPSPTRMWSDFSGEIGEVEAQAHVQLTGPRLQGTIDLPRASPEALASVIPGLPLRAPIDASVEIDGDLPTLALHGRLGVIGAEASGGEIGLDGRLDVTSPLRLDLDLDAHGFDVGALYPLPASPLDVSGSLVFELGVTPRLVAEARTSALVIGETLVPAADLHVVLDHGILMGTATLHEAGAPVEATLSLSPRDGLAFEALVDVPALRDAPRLAGPLDGAARVRVIGTLKAGALDARVNGTFSNLHAKEDLRVDHGGIEGRIRGPVARPEALEVDASIWGRQVKAGGYSFDRLVTRASGAALSPHLDATLLSHPPREGQPDDDPGGDGVRASGDLDARHGAVTALKVSLRRDGTELGGEIARIGGGAGGLSIEGAHLEGKGVGKLQGGLRVHGKEIAGKIHGEGMDLDRLRRLAGLTQAVQGLADFDVDLTPTRGGGRRGHLDVAIENGEASLFTGVSATLSTTFDGDKIKADALVRLIQKPGEEAADPCRGSIAQLSLRDGEGVLDGALLDPAAWLKLSGHAEIGAEDWDLHCLASRLPDSRRLFREVQGWLSAHATVERAPGQRFPSLRDASLRTRSLELTGPGLLDKTTPAWESRALDLQLQGSLDGQSGQASAQAILFDGEVVLDSTLEGTLDLNALVDRPMQRWETLRAAPLHLYAAIPRRPIGSFTSLPSFVRARIPALAGELSADATLQGSLEHPVALLKVSAFGLASAKSLGSLEPTSLTLPVDVDAVAGYEAAKATVDLHVRHDRKEIVGVSGQAAVDLHELLDGKTPSWTGGVTATLTEVPLGEVPFLADRDIGGHLSGSVALTGIHDRPALAVNLTAPDLELGQDFYLDHGTFQLDVTKPSGDDDHATARLRAELVGQDGGRLDASGFAGVRWQGRVAPTVDFASPADLYAKATGFRLAAFHPLVVDVLSKLDGLLDGDVRVGWSQLSDRQKGIVAAKMTVKNGVFHVPQIGQEFHDASVTVESRPDGTLAFKGIRAEGTHGRIQGEGSATLDGLVFKSAEARLSIPKGDEIPLTLEGVPVGIARGDIAIQAEKDDREIRASVSIPSFHLDLPTASSRAVFSLEEDPAIHVSHPVGPIQLPRSPDALTWALTLDLKRLEISGNNIEVSVAGSHQEPPRVTLRDKVMVAGDLELLPGGRIQVLGKQFVIDYGVVTLRPEEAGNPFLNVRAHWEGAPAGTTIYVEYLGVLRPITPEKLRFRSDSGLSQDAIQAMLLGSGDPGATAESGGGGVQAVQQLASGVAAELASQQLNAALAGTALRGFSTQFGFNDDGTLRPGVAYNLSDQLRVGAKMETVSPTVGTTAATPIGCVSATKTASCAQLDVDWRFRPNWLLRGSVTIGGDLPSSGVDLLWQYRY